MFHRRFTGRISDWRRAFESESLEQRRAAAEDLMRACFEEKNPTDAVPLIESLLRDPDDEIGECATSALCRCGTAALPVVERMSASASAHLRERACYIIGHLSCETQPLHAVVFAALSDLEPGVRAQAAFALSRMADRSRATVEALAAAVHDPAPKVRLWALEAFRVFSLDEEVPASLASHGATILSALADEDPDVRKSALSTLEEFEMPATQILTALLDRLRVESNKEVLMNIRLVIFSRELQEDLAQHLPALLTAADANPSASALVFEICGDLGVRATAALPQLETVAASPGTSYEAVEALWKITGSSAKCVPALERLLERDWLDASRALELLSKMTDSRRYVIPMLRHALPDSPDEAAGMICDLGTAAAPLLPELARVIEEHWEEPDWDLMWALVDALYAIESSETLAVSTLGKLLTHPSPRVRVIAVKGLGRAGPAARAALGTLEKAVQDEDREVAKAARAAIREVGRPAN
ncbi:MAG TPA: HEAT repeat domain-containing protein [Steroidobacteraceae bacterium]